MTWVFQESDPMGGAPGEAYANTLKSTGMPPEHVLAREAIQNSVDAGLEGQKVRVCFRQVHLTGSAKANFISAAGLQEIVSRASHLELSSPNCFESLDRPRTPLSLVYVEDYNAVGLCGDPHDKGSNFHRLLLSLGDRSKGRTAKGSGGSYGYGKAVYSSSSAIQTIFAHTRFVGDDGAEHTRIFGCGYYASHDYRGKSYSGRAWLGSKKQADEAGRLIVDPLEDKQADKLAEKLGFVLREDGELGTTILIVDATVDLAGIVTGVEDWWWPRLIANKLDVEVYDDYGVVSVPRPKRNEQLRPFIEAFEIATNMATPKAGTQKLNALNRLGDRALGTCGFVVAPLNDEGAPSISNGRWNAVALIRVPLMVVAYQVFSSSSPVVVGSFMAADDVDSILKKSEPPAHDRWDADSTNLRDAKGEGKEVVGAVLSRIRGGLRRFQSEAAPPAPAKQKRLSILERALGTYFRPQGHGTTHPPSTTSLVHLDFTKQPYVEATPAGALRLQGAFTVSLDQKTEDESVNLRVHVRCPVLEDDGEEGDDLNLNIGVKGVDAKPDAEEPRLFRFTMSKSAKAHFTVASEEYDPAWTVRLHPEIDEEVAR
jgi:hypothetical protein